MYVLVFSDVVEAFLTCSLVQYVQKLMLSPDVFQV